MFNRGKKPAETIAPPAEPAQETWSLEEPPVAAPAPVSEPVAVPTPAAQLSLKERALALVDAAAYSCRSGGELDHGKVMDLRRAIAALEE